MIYFISANDVNIGDVLSSLGIRKLLGAQGVNLYCDRPYVECTKKAIRSAQSDDIFVIGGGGLFMDYFMPFWNEIYRNRKQLRYVLWGIGFCDHKRPGLKRFLRRKLMAKPVFFKRWKGIVENSMASSFRDENTYQYFRGASNSFKIGCPSINFILDHKKELPRNLLIHSCHQNLLNPEEVTSIEKTAATLAHKLGLEEVTTDRTVRGMPELYGWLDRYSCARLTVSSSLHGCILALALGSKLIAVSKDWKIEGFLRLVDLEEAVCDIDEIEEKAERIALQKNVSDGIEKIKKENESFAKDVKALIA
jgi:hypothetical protein